MSSDGGGQRGRLIVISGPSGSGKSTLWHRLVQHPRMHFSVSATTRPPRPDEVDGRDYHFLSAAEFHRLLDEDAFLEHAEVHGHHYGTLRREVEAAMDRGEDVLLEIDVQGAAQVRRSGLPAVSIFVLPPSLGELERRLRARGTEDEATLRRRLANAAREMEEARHYDHQVVNDDLERMVAEVERLLGLQDPAKEARR